MNKPMSAAQYAAHVEDVDAQRPTEIKTLKSGAVFELRRPDIERLVILGLVPQGLLEEGIRAWEKSGIKKKGAKESIRLSAQDTQRSLILMREVVADVCVSPPFNESTAKFFLKQDFNEIYHWAMSPSEGPATEGLKSFRKGRKRRTATNKPDSKELPPETVSTAAN
jgi:hypothetical protein